jgi:hypothetical protein
MHYTIFKKFLRKNRDKEVYKKNLPFNLSPKGFSRKKLRNFLMVVSKERLVINNFFFVSHRKILE